MMEDKLRFHTDSWFAEFKPFEGLTLMHVIDFIPGVEPYESTIEVDFHASGDHARMAAAPAPPPNPPPSRAHQGGGLPFAARIPFH
jgi:hypothetical protein